MFKVAEDFEMEAQPHLLLLQKTMMMAEGVGRSLNPNVNMWKLAEPLVLDWARKNFGAKAKLDGIKNIVLEVLEKIRASI
jgi:ubiquinone biosynthesis protein